MRYVCVIRVVVGPLAYLVYSPRVRCTCLFQSGRALRRFSKSQPSWHTYLTHPCCIRRRRANFSTRDSLVDIARRIGPATTRSPTWATITSCLSTLDWYGTHSCQGSWVIVGGGAPSSGYRASHWLTDIEGLLLPRSSLHVSKLFTIVQRLKILPCSS